jgi:hypothetical protein
MLEFARYATNIGGFVGLTGLFLSEAAKYLLLLIVAILSIRLWKRLPMLSGNNRRNNLLLACFSTLIAVVIGYFSICHSLSRLYFYYGMRSFIDGNVVSALSLLGQSSRYWKTADAQGAEGICLLLLGRPDLGQEFLDRAKVMRKGQSNSFEEFYEGVYYFFQDKPEALPLLARCSTDPAYTWNASKLYAVYYVDNNQISNALQLMQPFLQVEVTDTDQAYIMAALDLSQGKKADAEALVDKFGKGNLPPFWQSRFNTLRAKIQSHD